jgi:long-chain acyl-CoA synthetase
MNRDPDISHKLSKNMRHIFCGTAPLPIVLRQNFHETFGCHLQESYGMSEVLLVAAQTPTEAVSQINAGCPLPGIRTALRISQDISETELLIHTPFSLTSYLLEDGEISPLLDDGSMPSGDLGKIVNGALIITGRLKDLIIRGGVNVSPVAIENVLQREIGVKEVAVVGLLHDIWGESIVACLVAEVGVRVDDLQAKLQLRCTKELTEGMRPDRYVWMQNLPYATTGKVQKNVLIERLI